jgi:PAS domain S-box-containing protein
LILLILIMTAVAVGIGVAAITILYNAALDEERFRLVETAQSQARLMEAVARFDELYSLNYPEGSKAATIAQIKDAHERYLGFGETGEFTLARRVGEDIVFVLRHRHLDMDKPQPVPFDSNYAEPMRRALTGQSGTTIGLDYRGVTVLAAHEPVSVLDLGIVAKIDLVEIRAPFLKAAAFVAVIATVLIALGTVLFFRVGNPIIRRIQASEEKYRLAMEATQDGLWDWDVTTGSVYYSPGWNSIIGEKDTQNNYSTWEDRIHPEDKPRILETLGSHLAGESTVWQEEHRLRNIDGAWIWVLGRGRVVKHDRHGNPLRMVGTMSDIDARKQAEKVLAEAKETAELANISKTRFLAAASHDLRQPLQAISSHTDLLAISNTAPALAKPIKQLGDATLAMQELLEGLLDISKLDTNTMRPEMRAFSVSSLLSQLRDQYQSIAMEKGLTLELMPCTAVVRSDPTLLRVILQNLISNAIKYTHRGEVIVECRPGGDLIRIEVRDSGIGIAEDEQEAIFEEFYQLDNPARDRNKGTGIGLAIVKRMANLLNHPFHMHSVLGKGSSFAIEVPIADKVREETQAAHPGTAKSDNESTGSSILLIEDDEIVLDANYGLLKTLGYEVIPVSGVEAAMQWIASEATPPEIIISDYRLPGDFSGTELIQQIRTKAGSLIPAIILTGDVTVPNDNNFLPDNSLLVQKPARVEELVQAITQLLGNPVPSSE